MYQVQITVSYFFPDVRNYQLIGLNREGGLNMKIVWGVSVITQCEINALLASTSGITYFRSQSLRNEVEVGYNRLKWVKMVLYCPKQKRSKNGILKVQKQMASK